MGALESGHTACVRVLCDSDVDVHNFDVRLAERLRNRPGGDTRLDTVQCLANVQEAAAELTELAAPKPARADRDRLRQAIAEAIRVRVPTPTIRAAEEKLRLADLAQRSPSSRFGHAKSVKSINSFAPRQGPRSPLRSKTHPTNSLKNRAPYSSFL